MADETTGPASEGASKPLPAIRPGTSGTEALLITNRRRASAKYQKAQRAERTYKTKKRSAIARADWADARQHFSQTKHHLGEGVRLAFRVVRSVPYIIGERRDASSKRRAEKKREREQEKQRRREERWADDGTNASRSEEGGEANEATQ